MEGGVGADPEALGVEIEGEIPGDEHENGDEQEAPAEEAAGGCSLHCDDEISSNVSPEDEGFHLRIDYGGYPYTNRNGYTYVYMAFR